MDKMIETLKAIGVPSDEIKRLTEYYKNDIDGFRSYYLYMVALFDDRRDYV